jgi:hypothetical protein
MACRQKGLKLNGTHQLLAYVYDVYMAGENTYSKVGHERRLGGEEVQHLSFLTLALKEGQWSASRSGRTLPPRKEPPAPIVQEGAGC